MARRCTRTSRSRRRTAQPRNSRTSSTSCAIVLYAGYKFSDQILFNSEVEFEHASTGEGDEERGEVSVEFAYLDFKPWKQVGIRAGMVLLPIGFLNELHEPPIFLGARRPEVEQAIIPIDLARDRRRLLRRDRALPMAGLCRGGASLERGFTSEGHPEGRQQGSQSLAEDLAFTGRLDYVGVPGLLLGGSLFTGNSGQGARWTGGPSRAASRCSTSTASTSAAGSELRALFAARRASETRR